MIRFGELTQSTPEVKEIGLVANRLGRELLFGNTEDVIWEYTGPDLIIDSESVAIEEDISERLPANFNELGSAAIAEKQPESTKTAKGAVNYLAETITSPEDSESVNQEINNHDRVIDSEKSANSKFPELNANLQEFEFELDDVVPPSESESNLPELDAPTKATPTEQAADPVAIDMQQVMNLIQQDSTLAQEISAKLNVSPSASESLDSLPTNTLPNKEISTEVASDDSSIELIEGWFNLGLKQVSAGEFERAIASWEKALKINPNLSEAWHNRGSALGRLGEYGRAVESFDKALAIDPQNHQAWNDRAHALYQMQQWSAAAKSWSNAVKLAPGNHLFWYNRGCALEQLESWAEAINSYEKSLEIKPDFGPARSRYTNLVADSSHAN